METLVLGLEARVSELARQYTCIYYDITFQYQMKALLKGILTSIHSIHAKLPLRSADKGGYVGLSVGWGCVSRKV